MPNLSDPKYLSAFPVAVRVGSYWPLFELMEIHHHHQTAAPRSGDFSLGDLSTASFFVSPRRCDQGFWGTSWYATASVFRITRMTRSPPRYRALAACTWSSCGLDLDMEASIVSPTGKGKEAARGPVIRVLGDGQRIDRR